MGSEMCIRDRDHGEGVICGECASGEHSFDSARGAVIYDDIIRPLIVSFKHGDHTELGPLFVRWLGRVAKDLVQPGTILLPIPLHRDRLISRRFNQSAIWPRVLPVFILNVSYCSMVLNAAARRCRKRTCLLQAGSAMLQGPFG